MLVTSEWYRDVRRLVSTLTVVSHDGAYKHLYSVNFDRLFGVEFAALSDSCHQILYVEFAALSDSLVLDSLWGVRCSERLWHWRHLCRGISCVLNRCALNTSAWSQALVLGLPYSSKQFRTFRGSLCTLHILSAIVQGRSAMSGLLYAGFSLHFFHRFER